MWLAPRAIALVERDWRRISALRCPACGLGVFILPKSLLPEPPRPATKAAPKLDEELGARISRRLDEDPEELVDAPAAPELPDPSERGRPDDWVDAEVEVPPAEDDRDRRRGRRAKETVEPSSRQRSDPRTDPRSAQTQPGRGQTNVGVDPLLSPLARPPLAERLRRNKHILVFIAVPAFVLGTVLYTRWRQHLRDLPIYVERGRTEGLKALSEGKFDAANEILSKASRALDSLGEGIEGAADVRQGALESAIFVDRAPDSLETILDEAARLTEDDRKEKFRRIYKGRSIIVDDHVSRLPEGKEPYILEYRIGVQASPKARIGRLDLSGFDLFKKIKPKAGERIVFGARLEGIFYDEIDDVWLFEIEPESGVLMSWKPLEAFDNIPWEEAADAGVYRDSNVRSSGGALTAWEWRCLWGGELGKPLSIVSSTVLLAHRIDEPPTVDSTELLEKPDKWIGKEVIVDERVKFFRPHPKKGFDEVVLAGDRELTCEIPETMRPAKPPRQSTARLKGILKRGSEGRMVLGGLKFELLPVDLERLKSGLEALPPNEYERRAAWGDWARRRGLKYHDEELLKAGKDVEAEALAIEGREKIEPDQPGHWLRLARLAKQDELPEQQVTAFAHMALRARLSAAKTTADHEAIFKDVQFFLNGADVVAASKPKNLDRWLEAYKEKIDETYRTAPSDVRSVFDRRLYADALESLLFSKAKDQPKAALKFASEALSKLSDRPAAAESLRTIALESNLEGVSELRPSEVHELGASLEKALGRPDGARELYRRWLDYQRDHALGANDAEGRVTLAEQYVTLLGDRSSAASLLYAAEKLATDSKAVSEAFIQLGFRKTRTGWVDAKSEKPKEPDPSESKGRKLRSKNDLRGRTKDEVIGLMGGKPDRVVRVVTQSEVLEQWIFKRARGSQFINFSRLPGDSNPTSSASFEAD